MVLEGERLGRRALVTGATSGIGRAFARQLASDGWSLTLVARDEARLEELAREFGEQTSVVVADLSTVSGVQSLLPACTEQDLLINCAGVLLQGPLSNANADEIERAVYLMTTSVMLLTKAALAGMLARDHGAILNVSSRSAFVPESGLAVYCATKAAVRSFTLAVAREVQGTGVRVHLCCPGNTRTELHARAGIAKTGERLRVEPEFVAQVALDALKRGQRVSVPGERKLDTLLARMLAGRFSTKLAGILTRLSRG